MINGIEGVGITLTSFYKEDKISDSLKKTKRQGRGIDHGSTI